MAIKGLSGFTVLVADDTEADIDILMERLRDTCDVAVTMGGETASETVEEKPPAIISLDIMMPGMDGFNVA